MSEPVPALHSFEEAAFRVQAAIDAAAPDVAAEQLHQLAEQFAASDELRDDSLLLLAACRENPAAAEQPAQRQALAAQLLTLRAGFAQQGGMAGIEARRRNEARLSAHLRQAAAPASVIFECQGLVKRYATSKFQFGPIDLQLKAGEITGVVGQNGHGKTTLLRMVAGELLADAGQLAYPAFGQTGKHLNWSRVKREVAYVPQELPRWRGSLAENLSFEAAIHGLRGEDNERAVRLMVERLDLAEHLDKRWDSLAGGFKLRFALARALITQPRLLVMDEPLANLDQKARGLLLRDVHDLARSYRRPIAVLMSSHDLQGLEQICGQMVFLKNGQVAYVGAVEGIASFGPAIHSHEFELGSPLPVETLRERLAGTPVQQIRQEGLHAMLITAKTLDRSALLRLLLERGIDVHYFRDNSRSVRRLFD